MHFAAPLFLSFVSCDFLLTLERFVPFNGNVNLHAIVLCWYFNGDRKFYYLFIALLMSDCCNLDVSQYIKASVSYCVRQLHKSYRWALLNGNSFRIDLKIPLQNRIAFNVFKHRIGAYKGREVRNLG